MEITDPEILRTEKFGSRERPENGEKLCCICGRALLAEEFVCDVIGNLFCGERCKDDAIKSICEGLRLNNRIDFKKI